MTKTGLTVHMVVKNEDHWVWFVLQSVLPYADRVLITDTGSTDDTVEIIKSVKSSKIEFTQQIAATPQEVTAIRQQQISKTKTEWMWVVDGDEIYTSAGAQEVVTRCQTAGYDIGVIRRYDLLGDIYHRQRESVGTYNLFGHSGHLLIRCVRLDAFPGLVYAGDYPNEGLCDGKGVSLLDEDPSRVWISQNSVYHAMYLKRSSTGANIVSMFNRSKYKVETGNAVTSQYPEVFNLPRPNIVPDPRQRRSLVYTIGAGLVTPIKNIKRLYISPRTHRI